MHFKLTIKTRQLFRSHLIRFHFKTINFDSLVTLSRNIRFPFLKYITVSTYTRHDQQERNHWSEDEHWYVSDHGNCWKRKRDLNDQPIAVDEKIQGLQGKLSSAESNNHWKLLFLLVKSSIRRDFQLRGNCQWWKIITMWSNHRKWRITVRVGGADTLAGLSVNRTATAPRATFAPLGCCNCYS